MNPLKALILILIFYFLTLLQTAFLFYIPLVLILAVLINLFERPQHLYGILVAVSGGFFLDIFSSGIIGIQVLILLFLVLFIKLVLRRYVRNPVYPV